MEDVTDACRVLSQTPWVKEIIIKVFARNYVDEQDLSQRPAEFRRLLNVIFTEVSRATEETRNRLVKLEHVGQALKILDAQIRESEIRRESEGGRGHGAATQTSGSGTVAEEILNRWHRGGPRFTK